MNKYFGWLAAGLIASLPFGPAYAETITLLMPWSSNDKPSYVQAETFQKAVSEVSGGKLDIKISGPEVVPPMEQLQPVSAGVFDMLFTHGAYHAGSKGLALLVDALSIDPAKRREAGIFDFMDKYYQENHGLKLIALNNQSDHGYQCVFNKPITPDGDWSGMKIRGVSSYHGLIAAMGAAPVAIPFAETYTALERGVVDGTCTPAAGVLAYKVQEVTKYRVAPSFGALGNIFVINLTKWDSLSEENKAFLLEAGKKTEIDNIAIGNKLVEEEWAELDRQGMEVVTLTPENQKKVQDAFINYQWVLGEQCCGSAAQELRDLARKAGLTN